MNNKINDSLRILKKEADCIQIFLNDAQIRAFGLYLEELTTWNKKINLFGRRNDLDIVIKDFLDSLMITKHLPEGSTLIDIGSGAGFPGIPIKISRQDLTVGLLEIRGKRISFLKHMIRVLNFDNLKVISWEDEGYKKFFDFSVSRAFGSAEKFADVSEPYLGINAVILLMKGKNGDEELKRELPVLEKKGWMIYFRDRFQLPVIGHERVIFGLKRICFT
jgi:16S rRNA (guanine(527)-N(7))-methyltransferase RsmG